VRDSLQLFGRNLLGSAAVIIAGLATIYFLGFHLPPLANSIGIVVSLSILFALLLTADSRVRADSSPPPTTFWAGVVDLVANRQPLVLFLAIAVSIAAAGTYYIFTSLVTVQYAGESGVIFSLPGQTVYYLPIDPYESWMSTGIQLAKDERFTVELSGRVSPGYLQGLDILQTQYNALANNAVEKKSGGAPKITPLPAFTPLPRWPFTGPEGYDRSWYEAESLLEVFKHEPVSRFYGKDRAPGYKNDNGLTVKGYPHNTVIAMIVRDDEPPPKIAAWNYQAEAGTPGYNSDSDKDALLILSSKRYPIECHAQRAGRLWVVINDSEGYRWDNAGFFFLKLTRYSSTR
jgi:hypothetical protein